MVTRVVPSGSPPWTRTATIENFGGHLEKQDYLHRSPIDILTDVGASSFARMTNDMAALSRTAPLCVITFGKIGSAGREVSHVHMMTGVRIIPYLLGQGAPHGLPRVDRESTGIYLVTFPATLTDSFGVEAPVSIAHATADAMNTVVSRAVCELVSAMSVRVRIYNEADALIDPIEICMEVF